MIMNVTSNCEGLSCYFPIVTPLFPLAVYILCFLPLFATVVISVYMKINHSPNLNNFIADMSVGYSHFLHMYAGQYATLFDWLVMISGAICVTHGDPNLNFYAQFAIFPFYNQLRLQHPSQISLVIAEEFFKEFVGMSFAWVELCYNISPHRWIPFCLHFALMYLPLEWRIAAHILYNVSVPPRFQASLLAVGYQVDFGDFDTVEKTSDSHEDFEFAPRASADYPVLNAKPAINVPLSGNVKESMRLLESYYIPSVCLFVPIS